MQRKQKKSKQSKQDKEREFDLPHGEYFQLTQGRNKQKRGHYQADYWKLDDMVVLNCNILNEF